MELPVRRSSAESQLFSSAGKAFLLRDEVEGIPEVQ